MPALYYTQQPATVGPQQEASSPAPAPGSPFMAAAVPPQRTTGDAYPYDASEGVSEYEAGVRRGQARDPQPVQTEAKGAPTMTTPDASILRRALGWALPPRHPVPTLMQFRQYDGAPNPSATGLHAEMIPGLTTQVPQGQQPVAGTGANTFRAAPQPWDAGFTVGASVYGAR